MGYNMKRGNSAVPFKELGSSPAKFDIKSEKAKNKRPNYGVKNTGNFMNLEEFGYGPADNIDFQKGTGSIGDAVLPSDKNDKPVTPKSGDMSKYSDLEKYDDDNPTGKAESPKKKKK